MVGMRAARGLTPKPAALDQVELEINSLSNTFTPPINQLTPRNTGPLPPLGHRPSFAATKPLPAVGAPTTPSNASDSTPFLTPQSSSRTFLPPTQLRSLRNTVGPYLTSLFSLERTLESEIAQLQTDFPFLSDLTGRADKPLSPKTVGCRFDSIWQSLAEDHRLNFTRALCDVVLSAAAVLPRRPWNIDKLMNDLLACIDDSSTHDSTNSSVPRADSMSDTKGDVLDKTKTSTESIAARDDDNDDADDEDSEVLNITVRQLKDTTTTSQLLGLSQTDLESFRFGECSKDMDVDTPLHDDLGSALTYGSLPSFDVVETDHVTRGEDAEGNKTINQFSVITELGRGGWAKVKLAMHVETNKAFAIKVFNKSILQKVTKSAGTSALTMAKAEVAIMKKIAHPRIVRLHEVIDDPTAGKLYMILDYIDEGPVMELDSKGCAPALPAEKVVKYMRQIVSGLSYLHRHNIIHRDIKPSNILRDHNDDIYLCDFGVSALLEPGNEVVNTVEGTPLFMSPEMCRGEGGVNGKIADIWALGVTMFVMLFGFVPFNGATRLNIMSSIMNDPIPFPPGACPDASNLIRRLLEKDPAKRISLEEIKSHCFITGGAARRPSTNLASVTISHNDIEKAVQVGQNVVLMGNSE